MCGEYLFSLNFLHQDHSPMALFLAATSFDGGILLPAVSWTHFLPEMVIKHDRLPLLIVAGHYVTKFWLTTTIRSVFEWAQKNRRVPVQLQEQFRWLMPIGFCASLDIGLSNCPQMVSFGRHNQSMCELRAPLSTHAERKLVTTYFQLNGVMHRAAHQVRSFSLNETEL